MTSYSGQPMMRKSKRKTRKREMPQKHGELQTVPSKNGLSK